MTVQLVQPTQAQIDAITEFEQRGWVMVEGPSEFDSLGTWGGVYGIVVTFEMKTQQWYDFASASYYNSYVEVIFEEDGTKHFVN